MPQSTNQQTAIRNLQTYLRQLSYHNPEIPVLQWTAFLTPPRKTP